MDCIDHRWGQRSKVAIEVDFEFSGGSLVRGRGWIRELSLSGALLDVGRELPPLTMLRVMMPAWRRTRGGRDAVTASVVRSTPAGVAVEWSEFAPPLVFAWLGAHPEDAAACQQPINGACESARRKQPVHQRVELSRYPSR